MGDDLIYPILIVPSADLEVTVALLVQIDKLVQLIESPVFTCGFYRSKQPARCQSTNANPTRRPEAPTS